MSFNKTPVTPNARPFTPPAAKEFDLKVLPLWHPKSGNENILEIYIKPETIASLELMLSHMKADGGGGKLYITTGMKRPKDTSPHAYMNYASKESVDAFFSSIKNGGSL